MYKAISPADQCMLSFGLQKIITECDKHIADLTAGQQNIPGTVTELMAYYQKMKEQTTSLLHAIAAGHHLAVSEYDGITNMFCTMYGIQEWVETKNSWFMNKFNHHDITIADIVRIIYFYVSNRPPDPLEEKPSRTTGSVQGTNSACGMVGEMKEN